MLLLSFRVAAKYGFAMFNKVVEMYLTIVFISNIRYFSNFNYSNNLVNFAETLTPPAPYYSSYE